LDRDPLQEKHTDQILRIAEDDFRRRILEISPQIRADVDVMASLIRELVNLEREKLGLDKPRGTLELIPNKAKKNPGDPDLIGSGRIAGRSYKAAAWISGKEKIRVSLLPLRTR
jgi:hypothetical protein